MERHAARSAFEAFGARGWTERAAAMAEGGSSADGPTGAGQPATFSCVSDTRIVVFAGQRMSLHDLKGFRYIERLLADPHREFHVLDLVAVEQGTLPTGQGAPQGLDIDADAGDGGLAVLDQQARQAYRRRLIEVEDDIDEATRLNDIGRVELANRDREYLIAELSRAVGLGGRHRSVGGSAERARTAVTRSMRYALGRLAEYHPTLASHLEQSVHTGTYCSYAPDPLTDVDWRI